MCSIYNIAHWFLQHTTCDQKKLQKLCYYAQAWHLALYRTRLFQNRFEAWVHGPVCRGLWNKLSYLGFENVSKGTFNSFAKELDEKTNQFLLKILATYGQYSGFELECLTHTEDPWLNARKGYSELERCTVEISEADMMSYYYSLIQGEGLGE